MAVSSGSGRVYAPNWIANTLVTLDGQNHSVVGQAPVGPMPWRVTVNPRNERVYVADGTAPGADQGSLYTVEGWDGTVQGRALGAVPLGVAVDPSTQEVLVTDARLGTLSVLDENGQQVRWQGVVGPAPHTVVPVRGLGRAYVILSGQNALAVMEWPPRDRGHPDRATGRAGKRKPLSMRRGPRAFEPPGYRASRTSAGSTRGSRP